MNNDPFVMERTYDAPIKKVWQAITDKDQMKQWYFNVRNFKPEVGCEFYFDAGDKEVMFRHLCKVTSIEKERKIAYTWGYQDYPGNSEVTFELFEEGDKTRLKLTHTGLETFPQGNPSFAKESFAGGWTHITGVSLKEFLEK